MDYHYRCAITRVVKVFQQKNAQTQLMQAEQALNAAKQQYQQAPTPTVQSSAIASWQAAIDQLEQVPPETLAGRTAETKLVALKRDFEQVAGLAAGGARTSTLIEASQ